jgi:hypothetical protein
MELSGQSELVGRRMGSGIQISAVNGDVILTSARGGQKIQRLRAILEQPGELQLSQRIDAAVTSCLQGAQDFVVDVTGENWPSSTRAHGPASREGLLLVVVTVGERSIRMFFGETANTPVLELPPIPLGSPTTTSGFIRKGSKDR